MKIENYLFQFENVKKGDTYDNYIELCRALGVRAITSGNGKITQLKRIKEYLDLERIKGTRKYYVKGIKGE